MTYLVTGANGFLATEIIHHLLEQGHRVIGTVRNKGKQDRLCTHFDTPRLTFEHANVLEHRPYDSIFQRHPEIVCVIHTAQAMPSHEDGVGAILKAAQTTITHLLEAVCEFAPQVVRVVYTSSTASVGHLLDPVQSSPRAKKLLTENDWADYSHLSKEALETNGVLAYVYAKAQAEKLAFEFLQHHPHSFAFKSVLPPFIFGPMCLEPRSLCELNDSNNHISHYVFEGRPPAVPGGCFAHVETVALAHVQLADPQVSDELDERIIVCDGKFLSAQVLHIIRHLYPQMRDAIALPPESNVTEDALVAYDTSVSRNKLTLPSHTFTSVVKGVNDQYIPLRLAQRD